MNDRQRLSEKHLGHRRLTSFLLACSSQPADVAARVLNRSAQASFSSGNTVRYHTPPASVMKTRRSWLGNTSAALICAAH
jgi:hypothetical protein